MNDITQQDALTLDQIVWRGHEITPAQWAEVNVDYDFRKAIGEEVIELTRVAYAKADSAAENRVHDILGRIYEQDFSIPGVEQTECDTQPVLRDIASILERAMFEHELTQIPMEKIADYPRDGKAYVNWLLKLINAHGAATHEFYESYVGADGTPEDLRFLMVQESSLDPRFDDILALVQVGTTGLEKMEIAKNYWDEMGNGVLSEVHSTMFGSTHETLNIDSAFVTDNILLEAKVCGNVSAALALSRRHYYKAVGYYGTVEYLVPRRFAHLTKAWADLGMPAEGIKYHLLHMEIDVEHGESWLYNVIGPAIDRDPRLGLDIAIGTYLRLNTSERYLDGVLAHCRTVREQVLTSQQDA